MKILQIIGFGLLLGTQDSVSVKNIDPKTMNLEQKEQYIKTIMDSTQRRIKYVKSTLECSKTCKTK